MTQYAGIDYGLGRMNVDQETGIRYGIISQHTVGQAWYELAEGDYGKPTCPKCGNEVKASDDPALFADNVELNEAEDNPEWFDGQDYTCVPCQTCYWYDEVFSEEAIGWSFEDSNYTLTDCLDSDIFVLKSPYYTYAQYCSPCVPGACNLDHPLEIADGENTDTLSRCYALGHDWFWDTESGQAPYRVWRVKDDTEVLTEVKAEGRVSE
jgi:hypothetical protein